MKQKKFRNGALLRAVPAGVFLLAAVLCASLKGPAWLTVVFLGLLVLFAAWLLWFISKRFQIHSGAVQRKDIAKEVFNADEALQPPRSDFFNKAYHNAFSDDTLTFFETGIVLNANSNNPHTYLWEDVSSMSIEQIDDAQHLPQIRINFTDGEVRYIYFDIETFYFLKGISGKEIDGFAVLKSSLEKCMH
jgi:hypothetical protein